MRNPGYPHCSDERHLPSVEKFKEGDKGLPEIHVAASGLGTIRHTVSATTATEEQAGHLNVAPGDPLLLVRTTALLDEDQLIEHTTSFYRADRYEYRTAHMF